MGDMQAVWTTVGAVQVIREDWWRPSVGRNFASQKTEQVIANEVLMVQQPTGTENIDTGCRSACAGHDFHASLLLRWAV